MCALCAALVHWQVPAFYPSIPSPHKARNIASMSHQGHFKQTKNHAMAKFELVQHRMTVPYLSRFSPAAPMARSRRGRSGVQMAAR